MNRIRIDKKSQISSFTVNSNGCIFIFNSFLNVLLLFCYCLSYLTFCSYFTGEMISQIKTLIGIKNDSIEFTYFFGHASSILNEYI